MAGDFIFYHVAFCHRKRGSMNPLQDQIIIRVPQRMGKVKEGVQKAKLIDLDTGSGDYGKYIKFIFELTGSDGKKGDLPYYASQKIAPAQGKAKESILFSVLKALHSDQLKEGAEINLNSLLNKECQVVVEINEKSGYPTIIEVMPLS